MAVGAAIIQGDKELQRIMKRMRTTSARRTMTAGAGKAAQLLAKKVKATIPTRFKGAKQAIGWRRLKVKEEPGGGAKIGGRVGRASKASIGKRAEKRKNKNRKGVGIGAQNIQWFFDDVTHRPRRTKTTRKYTGVMLSKSRGIPSVDETANRNLGALKAEFRNEARKRLKIEIKEGKAFA